MGNNRNEYDSMKNMLDKIRDFQKQQLNESLVAPLQPQELEDEKTKFKEGVSPNVEFGPFNRTDGNVEFSGVLIKEKISWLFSLAQTDGCYVSCENLQLSDDNVKTIQKLSSYYTQWSDYWGNAMSN